MPRKCDVPRCERDVYRKDFGRCEVHTLALFESRIAGMARRGEIRPMVAGGSPRVAA